MDKSVKITIISVFVLLIIIVGGGLYRTLHPVKDSGSSTPQVSSEQREADPQAMRSPLSRRSASTPAVRARTQVTTQRYYFPRKRRRKKVVPKQYMDESGTPEHTDPEETWEEEIDLYDGDGEPIDEPKEEQPKDAAEVAGEEATSEAKE